MVVYYLQIYVYIIGHLSYFLYEYFIVHNTSINVFKYITFFRFCTISLGQTPRSNINRVDSMNIFTGFPPKYCFQKGPRQLWLQWILSECIRFIHIYSFQHGIWLFLTLSFSRAITSSPIIDIIYLSSKSQDGKGEYPK